MKKLIKKVQKTAIQKAKKALIAFHTNTSGEQLTGLLITVLIIVVVGAAFLAYFQDGLEDLWSSMIVKAKGIFGL